MAEEQRWVMKSNISNPVMRVGAGGSTIEYQPPAKLVKVLNESPSVNALHKLLTTNKLAGVGLSLPLRGRSTLASNTTFGARSKLRSWSSQW